LHNLSYFFYLLGRLPPTSTLFPYTTLFRSPTVQTTVAKKLTDSIRERSDVNLSIGRVSISYFGRLQLNEVYVEDHHQDTLLYVHELKSSLLVFRNLLNNTPDLGNTTADGFTFNMKRYKGEETYNLSIVMEKFRTESTCEKKLFELLIHDINITNGYYTYVDENLEVPVIIEFNDLNFQAEDLQ